MKKLSQKMSLENRMILLNHKSEVSNFLLQSLDQKNSWTQLTLKDCFYLDQIFGLKLDVLEIDKFFNN
jgi:hypothetical protein